MNTNEAQRFRSHIKNYICVLIDSVDFLRKMVLSIHA